MMESTRTVSLLTQQRQEVKQQPQQEFHQKCTIGSSSTRIKNGFLIQQRNYNVSIFVSSSFCIFMLLLLNTIQIFTPLLLCCEAFTSVQSVPTPLYQQLVSSTIQLSQGFANLPYSTIQQRYQQPFHKKPNTLHQRNQNIDRNYLLNFHSMRYRYQSRFQLTTTVVSIDDDDDVDDNDDDDDKNKTVEGIPKTKNTILTYCRNKISLAKQKFYARPGTYLLIPCIAAIVGWVTNWLAVQMIFYPINFWGIEFIKRPMNMPLGFIGWQGIVPCKTEPMTIAIVDMVTSQLLTVSEAFHRLDPKLVSTLLAPEIPKIIHDIVQNDVQIQWIRRIPGFFTTIIEPIVNRMNENFISSFTVSLQQNADRIFHIKNCVIEQMMLDRSKLGELFQTVAPRELQFLTDSGLFFGFLLGLIQMTVALFWDNPWSLSIGGLIVGLATNWLALKWIFQPVDPFHFGPFVLQGQFLRRQKEVAAVFSNYFATNILNSKEIWKSVLTDPVTQPAFTTLFTQQVQTFVSKIPSFLLPISPASIVAVSHKVVKQLPNHIPVIFPYMDRALDLETTLRIKMEQMTSRKFERVLHPIFEEDELALILAGAVLGFLAGLIQQGLETGQLKVPGLSVVKTFLQNKFSRLIQKNNKDSDTKSNSSKIPLTDDDAL